MNESTEKVSSPFSEPESLRLQAKVGAVILSDEVEGAQQA